MYDKKENGEFLKLNNLTPEQSDNYQKWQKTNNDRQGEYLTQRGISLITQNTYRIGLAENWYHPDNPQSKHYAQDRIIFPTSERTYTARATDSNTDIKFKAMKYGNHAPFFGQNKALEYEYIFVCEGETDALSIAECGFFNVLALGGVSNANKFVNLMKKQNRPYKIILILDNDRAGNQATSKIYEALTKEKIKCIKVENLSAKDPNELLQQDKKRLEEILLTHQANFEEIYTEQQAMLEPGNILKTIKEMFNPLAVPPKTATGFKQLDYKLFGGLPAGLIFLGAETGAGKTTFCYQMAEQMSAQGTTVLYFSLEMSKRALVAKSFSRHSRVKANSIIYGKYHGDKEIAESVTDKVIKNLSNLKIYETAPNGDPLTAQHICSITRNEQERNGNNSLVVIVDFLQLLAPTEDNFFSDKQKTDTDLRELIKLKTECNIPVICISALNRKAYEESSKETSLANFKESGSIEYLAELALVLKKNNTSYGEGMEGITLKSLKNRYGGQLKIDYKIDFNTQNLTEMLSHEQEEIPF